MVDRFRIFRRERNHNKQIARDIKRDRKEREKRAIKLREYDEKRHRTYKKEIGKEEIVREKTIELSKEDLERYYIFYNLTLNQISHLKIGLESIILHNKKRESILSEMESKKIEIKISDKAEETNKTQEMESKKIEIEVNDKIDNIYKTHIIKNWNKFMLDFYAKINERFEIFIEKSMSLIYIKRKLRDENEWQRFVNAVAQDEVAVDFTYQNIIDEIHNKRGLEIYAYLDTYYPEDCRALLESGVLERAKKYAEKKYIPEILTLVTEIILRDYKEIPIEFDKEYTFDNFPNRPFKSAIIYAPDDLQRYIKWFKGFWHEVDGYWICTPMGIAEILLWGWALPDKPKFILTFTPRQHQALFNAILNTEGLKEIEKQLYQKIIFYLQKDEIVDELRIEKQRQRSEVFKKELSDTIKGIKHDKYGAYFKHRGRQDTGGGKEGEGVDKITVLLILGIIAICFIFMVIF